MSHVLESSRHQNRFDFLSLNEDLEAPHSIQRNIWGSKLSLFDPHWIYMNLRSHKIAVIIVNVGVGPTCTSFRLKPSPYNPKKSPQIHQMLGNNNLRSQSRQVMILSCNSSQEISNMLLTFKFRQGFECNELS